MKKTILVLLSVLFTAQACNFLFGDLYGDQGSGSRGVYRSVDSGGTWEAANTVSKNENLNNAVISRVIVEPNNPGNILLAVQNEGLLGSDSHGEKWVRLLPDFSAYDAVVNPINTQEVFVAGAKSKLGAIYRSSDRAGTWVQVYSEPTGPSSVISVLLDKQNPLTLYAGLSTGTVIKSTDGGGTWKATANFKDRIVTLKLGIDPQRTVYALTRTAGLHRSVDGGQSWSKIVVSDEPKAFNDLSLDGNNPSTAYAATDKGLFVTRDGGQVWKRISLPVGVELASVTAVSVNPDDGGQVFAAIRSTVYRSDDRGITWRTANLPTRRIISSIDINPLEPNRVYVGVR